MSEDRKITYGNWEGWPTAYISGGYAWAYVDGAWKEVSGADVFTKSNVLTKEMFTKMFGKLPDPPSVEGYARRSIG